MKTSVPSYRPGRRLLAAARERPDDTALIVDDELWSYRELVGAARGLAERLATVRDGDAQPTTAVMAHRHASSYLGMLAARLAGHAMLPIAVNHPPARSAALLRRANARQIICGQRAEASLTAILQCDEAGARLGGDSFVIRCADDKVAWRSSMSGLDDCPPPPSRLRT